MGQSLINKKSCLYFLDELSLSAARQVDLSRLKLKTRLFVDHGLPQIYGKCYSARLFISLFFFVDINATIDLHINAVLNAITYIFIDNFYALVKSYTKRCFLD